MKHYRDNRPVVPRVYRRRGFWLTARGLRWLGWWRWQGYLGSDRPGTSYGLCPHDHLTPWMAMRCARKLVEAYV